MPHFEREIANQALPYATTVDLNFATFGQKLINLTGNLSLTASNMVNGRNLVVRLKSDASPRTLSFPVGWRWIGSTSPANIAANKVAMLWLWCFSGSESDVMARYLVEP